MAVEPHCSKCCPVEEPALAEPDRLSSGAAAWVLGVATLLVGGYVLLMWGASRLFG
ncbi:hypothetical protein [Streptomyces sp. NPDC051219]|uniref:hypothetical protein n=1 Tax=Streptomyces sp. NPDC051219 TaxID=3155283 RepID=UPI00344057CD